MIYDVEQLVIFALEVGTCAVVSVFVHNCTLWEYYYVELCSDNCNSYSAPYHSLHLTHFSRGPISVKLQYYVSTTFSERYKVDVYL